MPDFASIELPGSDCEIVVTRLLKAPRELAFKAWIDPAHVGHWWGPEGFTTTIHEMAVKPGGDWKFTMHGPDGIDYYNWIVFNAIDPPQSLRYTHKSENGGSDRFDSTVLFEAEGELTRVTMRMIFDTKADRDQTVSQFGAIEGAKQHLGNLAAYLDSIR